MESGLPGFSGNASKRVVYETHTDKGQINQIRTLIRTDK